MLFASLVMVMMIFIWTSQSTNSTSSRSFSMIVKSGIRFQRLNNFSADRQWLSRSRLHCINSCYQLSQCQIILFNPSDKSCSIFLQSIENGQILIDPHSELIYRRTSNPRNNRSMRMIRAVLEPSVSKEKCGYFDDKCIKLCSGSFLGLN
jgi:hypothetical protein